ncbi:hypothetical protein ACXR2U_08655 [Jatrophihabitans sp. YIM 134969]
MTTTSARVTRGAAVPATTPSVARPPADLSEVDMSRVDLSDDELGRSSVVAVVTGFVLLPAVLYLLAFGAATGPLAAVATTGTLVLFIYAVSLVSPVLTVCAIGGVILWQNTALGLLSGVFGTDAPFEAIEVKTIFLFTVAAAALVSHGGELRRIVAFRWFVPLALLLAGSLLLNPDLAAVAYLRNFTTIITVPIVGMWLTTRLGWPATRIVLIQMAKVSLIVLALGALGERILGTDAWREALNSKSLSSLNGVSQSTTFFFFRLPRSGSFAIEPVLAAFLVGGAVLAIVFLERRLTAGWLLLGVVLLLLTAGKGATVMVVIALVVRGLPALCRFVQRHGAVSTVGLWSAIAVGGLAYIAVALSPRFAVGLATHPNAYLRGGNSAVFHIAGFILALRDSVTHPVGFGLGEGGNLTRALDKESLVGKNIRVGGDTALGAMLYQLGLIGAGAYVAACTGILRAVDRHRWQLVTAVPLFVAWVAGWVYQEEISAPAEAFPILIVVGAVLAVRGPQQPAPPVEQQPHGRLSWAGGNG